VTVFDTTTKKQRVTGVARIENYLFLVISGGANRMIQAGAHQRRGRPQISSCLLAHAPFTGRFDVSAKLSSLPIGTAQAAAFTGSVNRISNRGKRVFESASREFKRQTKDEKPP
jgi:hypothetical protein